MHLNRVIGLALSATAVLAAPRYKKHYPKKITASPIQITESWVVPVLPTTTSSSGLDGQLTYGDDNGSNSGLPKSGNDNNDDQQKQQDTEQPEKEFEGYRIVKKLPVFELDHDEWEKFKAIKWGDEIQEVEEIHMVEVVVGSEVYWKLRHDYGRPS